MKPNDQSLLSAANAPAGLAICPNCRLKEPVDMNSAGGDFYRCVAPINIPEFGGVYIQGVMSDGHPIPINMKCFDPASTSAAGLNSRSCPLFQPKANG